MEDYQVAPKESDLPRHQEENEQESDCNRAYRRPQSARSHWRFALAVFPAHDPPYGGGDSCSKVGEERKEPEGYDNETGGEQYEDWSEEGEERFARESEVRGGREGESGH